MGFLTVINYIAMAVGYIVVILTIIFFSWIFAIMLKDRMQRKKWEKERELKEKTEKILEEKGIEKEEHEHSTAHETQEKTEHHKEKTEEKLVDESGKLKMV